MQGHERSKGMSKSEMGLKTTLVRADGNGHGTGRVGQGRAYGVPKTELRFEVRMENRKVMDTKQGSLRRTWVKGGQGLEFRCGVAQSITSLVYAIWTNL